MTKPRGVDAHGNDVDLIGQRIEAGTGSTPGVLVAVDEGRPYMAEQRTFERYHYNGSVIRVFTGDNVPEGAVKVEAPAERAKQAAPENKARKAAPQTKAKATAPETKDS